MDGPLGFASVVVLPGGVEGSYWCGIDQFSCEPFALCRSKRYEHTALDAAGIQFKLRRMFAPFYGVVFWILNIFCRALYSAED